MSAAIGGLILSQQSTFSLSNLLLKNLFKSSSWLQNMAFGSLCARLALASRFLLAIHLSLNFRQSLPCNFCHLMCLIKKHQFVVCSPSLLLLKEWEQLTFSSPLYLQGETGGCKFTCIYSETQALFSGVYYPLRPTYNYSCSWLDFI